VGGAPVAQVAPHDRLGVGAHERVTQAQAVLVLGNVIELEAAEVLRREARRGQQPQEGRVRLGLLGGRRKEACELFSAERRLSAANRYGDAPLVEELEEEHGAAQDASRSRGWEVGCDRVERVFGQLPGVEVGAALLAQP